jgi:hypothetical protein
MVKVCSDWIGLDIKEQHLSSVALTRAGNRLPAVCKQPVQAEVQRPRPRAPLLAPLRDMCGPTIGLLTQGFAQSPRILLTDENSSDGSSKGFPHCGYRDKSPGEEPIGPIVLFHVMLLLTSSSYPQTALKHLPP